MEMTSQTLAVSTKAFDDAALAAVQSFDDAAKLIDTLGIAGESIADYGTGFALVEKPSLLGVPFLILQWRFNEGSFQDQFVSIEAVTKHNEKVVFNDGSTGIRAQLEMVTQQRQAKNHPSAQAGLMVAGGLTKTDYFYNETTHETSSKPREGKDWKPAQTFYLAS